VKPDTLGPIFVVCREVVLFKRSAKKETMESCKHPLRPKVKADRMAETLEVNSLSADVRCFHHHNMLHGEIVFTSKYPPQCGSCA
jgi:hypothetical protein